MQILWHGGSTVELKQGRERALLNPDSEKDLKGVQILVFDRSQERHPHPDGVLMVDWPGEYDRNGFSFRGVEQSGKGGQQIAYNFHFPEGHVAWLGEMDTAPSEEFLKELGEVHVLLIPIGAGDVLTSKQAMKVVEAIEPQVVIPICYGGGREGLATFLKEMDVKHPEAQSVFDFKKSQLQSEQMDLVILNPS